MARVLIVDDEDAVLGFAEMVLADRHEVHALLVSPGLDPAKIEAFVRDLEPDILVTDYNMPIRPHRIVEWVRAASPRARVVLFTASSPAPIELERLGVDAHVSKPCSLAQLLDAVG